MATLPRERIDQINERCYNARADMWDRLPFADFLPEAILHYQSASSSKRALDIGSGTGMLPEWLQRHGFEMLCLDPSDEMVRRSRLRGLNTVQTTLQRFSTDDRYALITAVLSLIHVSKSEIAYELDRISSWLEPEGTFVLALIEGSGEGVDEPTASHPRYFSYYTHPEVVALTEKSFNCLFHRRTQGPISYLVYIFQRRT